MPFVYNFLVPSRLPNSAPFDVIREFIVHKGSLWSFFASKYSRMIPNSRFLIDRWLFETERVKREK